MLFKIIENYVLGLGFVGICIGVFIASVFLQTQVDAIPIIGPWLARNIRHIRDFAILAAALGLSHTMVYGIGVRNGELRKQAQWDTAERAAIDRAVQARSGAERDIKRVPANDGLRHDPNNRDN